MAPISASSTVGSLEKPMNVEHIVNMAGTEHVDDQFSLQHYFRSADLMVKQADIYEHEGNDQMAYFLLYRHATLILDTLTEHPQAKDPQFHQRWVDARKKVNKNLQKLEKLKPRINQRYERYRQRRVKVLAAQQPSHDPPRRNSRPESPSSLDQAFSSMNLHRRDDYTGHSSADHIADPLDPAEHRDMAVQMANQEIARRSQRYPQHPRDNLDPVDDDQDVRARMTDVRRRTELPDNQRPPRTSSRRKLSSSSSSKPYNYPSVPHHNDESEGQLRLPSFTSIKHQQPDPPRPPKAPQRPPKEYHQPQFPPESNQHSQNQPRPPPIPSKTAISPPPSPPPAHQFRPSAYLENGTPLRTIFLPTGLRKSFLRIAHPNTQRNLETCGILAGTLLRNAFFITRLIIPEQTSTSDTCEMVNEEALHAYVDTPQPDGSSSLMVLGWIHTHPTQTAFMSSRDLHTHCWYQVQLPESIAVVCAPSSVPDMGIFRLTDPPGMQAIKKCNKPGIFHPHEEDRIFTDAQGRPGHVIEHDELNFETVDLRPNGGLR